MESDSPAGFSLAEREIVLKILEECADSLDIYQNTLERRTGSAVNAVLPEIEYVERMWRDKTQNYDSSAFVYLSAGFRKRRFCSHLPRTRR